MWTPATLGNGQPNKGHYGFGWFVEDVRGHHVVRHDGEWQGFTSHISRYVDDKLTVVVLTNLAGADPGRVAARVADLYRTGGEGPN